MRELLSGLIGVFVGALLTLLREVWSDWRARARHARYLAIRVVCALDSYVESCADVASDDGLSQGQPNSEGYLEPQVSFPAAPAFSADLDWKSIESALMYRILSLPSQAETANRAIDAAWETSDPPDYEPGFEVRQDQYARLGLTAFGLTEELRTRYRIPRRDLSQWNPAEHLRKVKERVEEERRIRRRRLMESPVI